MRTTRWQCGILLFGIAVSCMAAAETQICKPCRDRYEIYLELEDVTVQSGIADPTELRPRLDSALLYVNDGNETGELRLDELWVDLEAK